MYFTYKLHLAAEEEIAILPFGRFACSVQNDTYTEMIIWRNEEATKDDTATGENILMTPAFSKNVILE